MLAPPAGPQRVTGLLRVTEPGGAFLRRNDPAPDHWYSRDVAAIARARGLGVVAPYFIDADRAAASAAGAAANPRAMPVGGLTRSDEHTSELRSLMRIPYAGFGLQEKNAETSP